MSDLKLEVGKTYVFIDDEARDAYIENSGANEGLLNDYYQDGFKLHEIINGGGFINDNFAINNQETKYFKLKETKMKATDIVNVEMTALDAMLLRVAVGKTKGELGYTLYRKLEEITKVKFDYFITDIDYAEASNWGLESSVAKWALSQFEPEKTERQIKIEKLQQIIDDVRAQIEELEG